jgi:hypothetical protein
LSPYFHDLPKVPEVLPISNRAGYRPAIAPPVLDTLLGKDAASLSPTTIERLTTWEKEYTVFRERDLCLYRRHG